MGVVPGTGRPEPLRDKVRARCGIDPHRLPRAVVHPKRELKVIVSSIRSAMIAVLKRNFPGTYRVLRPVYHAKRTLMLHGSEHCPRLYSFLRLPPYDYSQYGEQAIILDYFARSPGPVTKYCVDAGAFDGIVGSNSRALFHAGWRGVVIEPNPRIFSRLQTLYSRRTDVICVQAALSDREEGQVPMEFSIGPAGTSQKDEWEYAQVSTLDRSSAQNYKQNYGFRFESGRVNLRTLNSVLREAGAPRDIGFLSIDCEGFDEIIIRNLDFNEFKPRLICIESGDASNPPFLDFLRANGYRYYAHTMPNAFFELVPASPHEKVV